jgi:hypothetical protein
LNARSSRQTIRHDAGRPISASIELRAVERRVRPELLHPTRPAA